jgi:hypothetical protein
MSALDRLRMSSSVPVRQGLRGGVGSGVSSASCWPRRGPRAKISYGLVRRGGARYGSAWFGPACLGLARQGAARHGTVGSRPDGRVASHAHRVLPPKSGGPAVAVEPLKTRAMTPADGLLWRLPTGAHPGDPHRQEHLDDSGGNPWSLATRFGYLGILGNVASRVIPCQPRNGPKPQVEALKVDDHRPFTESEQAPTAG